MTNPLEDKEALSADEIAEMTGQAEEQDETGAPEKVAETDDMAPIESSEEQDRAPQPGNTPAPGEPPRDAGTITRSTEDDDSPPSGKR